MIKLNTLDLTVGRGRGSEQGGGGFKLFSKIALNTGVFTPNTTVSKLLGDYINRKSPESIRDRGRGAILNCEIYNFIVGDEYMKYYISTFYSVFEQGSNQDA